MFKTIKFKILGAFVVLIASVALSILICNIVMIRKLVWESVYSEHRSILLEAKNEFDKHLNWMKSLLIDLASKGELIKRGEYNFIKSVFHNNKDLMSLAVIQKRNGRSLIEVRRYGKELRFLKAGESWKGRDEFKIAASGRTYISGITYSRRTPIVTISILRGDNVYVLKFAVPCFVECISNIKLGDSGYVFAVDCDGKLILHPNPIRVYAGSDFSKLDSVRMALSGKKASWRVYRNEKNEAVISFYKFYEPLGLYLITESSYKEVFLPISKIVRWSIIVSCCLLVIFVVVGIKIVLRIINPIEQLKTVARRIASGKFDVKAEINTKDELQELADMFNYMVDSLRSLEELRKDLISMIVHDLKNPLTSIIGALDYAMSQKDTIKMSMLKIAKNAADSLLNMIQNLLDVSRMEEGMLKLNLTKVDLKELITQQVNQFLPLAKNENKRITKRIDEGISEIYIDKSLISRVLQNLFMNAIQHTTDGCHIEVVARKENGFVEIGIIDDGVGIPEEYKTKIFEKFVQIEKRRARLRTGVGLGLTFCKMAVELHNGKIWVKSGEGKGSAFYFTLPTNLA